MTDKPLDKLAPENEGTGQSFLPSDVRAEEGTSSRKVCLNRGRSLLHSRRVDIRMEAFTTIQCPRDEVGWAELLHVMWGTVEGLGGMKRQEVRVRG